MYNVHDVFQSPKAFETSENDTASDLTTVTQSSGERQCMS